MADSAAAPLGKQRRSRKAYNKKPGRAKESRTPVGAVMTGGPSQDNIATASSAETAAPVETATLGGAGPSFRNTRQKAKKGKKFVPLLSSAQPHLPTKPGLQTNVQQVKGASPDGSSAAATRLASPTRQLPEKESSEDHFPTLGLAALVLRDKRASLKPSEWAPPNDPKRDEAEEVALQMRERQRYAEEDRLSWLGDPCSPINGYHEVPSGPPVPTDGHWSSPSSGDWTTTRISGGSRTKILKAPYVFNEEWAFGKPLANQKSKIFSLSTEILTPIFFQLDRQSRVMFMLTSRTSSELMSRMLTVWDMSEGDFCGAEKGSMGDSRPTAITVVTAFCGSPVKDTVRHEVNVLKAMTLSFSLWTIVFRIVEFHRAPLVSMDLLQYIIPALPNLESLGIYECSLMHVGEAVPLLRAIRKNARLDFFPRRPVCYDVNMATRIALPAMLFTILPLAKKKNSRLIERGSAFESYLKLELPSIPVRQFKNIGDGVQDKQLVEIISAYKNCRSHPCPVNPSSNNGQIFKCDDCGIRLRGCFFAKAQFNNPNGPVCWGCKLTQALDDEKYDNNIDGHRHRELNYWHGNCSSLEEVVEAIKKECKEQDEGKTFVEYHMDDHRAKMAKSKFCNPTFYRQARAAWLNGEDPNEWWPEKRPGQSGRRPRRRGGW